MFQQMIVNNSMILFHAEGVLLILYERVEAYRLEMFATAGKQRSTGFSSFQFFFPFDILPTTNLQFYIRTIIRCIVGQTVCSCVFLYF